MVDRATVLLVSDDADLNLHLVKHVLQHRKIRHVHIDPTVRRRNFDFQLYSRRGGSRSSGEIVDSAGASHALASIRAVWNRGAAYAGGRDVRPGTSANLAHHESRYAYEYVWWQLKHCLWMNPLLDSQVSRNRMVQSRIAARCGLRVPDQIVTTNGAHVNRFARRRDKVVIKNASQGARNESGKHALMTEYLRQEDAKWDENCRFCAPVLLQGYIEKDYEVRAVVIGSEVFAAALDSDRTEKTALDSRWSGEVGLSYYRIKLTDTEQHALCKINRQLGLAYSSIDLIRGKDGHLHFLEANPSGQWSFIEMHTGYSITEAMVNLLTGSS